MKRFKKFINEKVLKPIARKILKSELDHLRWMCSIQESVIEDKLKELIIKNILNPIVEVVWDTRPNYNEPDTVRCRVNLMQRGFKEPSIIQYVEEKVDRRFIENIFENSGVYNAVEERCINRLLKDRIKNQLHIERKVLDQFS